MNREMKLGDIYRAGDVHRWQIVKTLRQQSVAEHSFHVAIIAIALYDKMCEDPIFRTWQESQGDGDDIEVLLRWALYHDIPEVLTGDVATPFKALIKQEGSDPFGKIERMVGGRYVDILGYIRERPVLWHIVKVADLIESVRFLADNACNEHGTVTYDRLKDRVVKYPYESVEFAGLDDWCGQLQGIFLTSTQAIMAEMFSPPLMLDDIVNYEEIDHEKT